MKGLNKICLCVVCLLLATNLSYGQLYGKIAKMTLPSCEIVNEPLKEYISEQFLPVILNGVESGKIGGYYIYMEIYKHETSANVYLICETGLRSGLVVRYENLNDENLRYRYFTVIDGVTIEIFCNKQNNFIKANSSPKKEVEYFTRVISIISDSSYEVKLKFEGEKLESSEVVDFVGLVERNESDLDAEKIYFYTYVEQRPYFPGGKNAMEEWISENLIYPPDASIRNSSGMVSVRFCVSETGEIYDVKVGWSTHEIFEEEAIRLVKAMPAWVPGRNNGEPVKVRYVLPIDFYKNEDQ